MLIQYYQRYKKEGLVEPTEVQKATLKYRESLDAIKEFIEENLVKQPGSRISWTDFSARYHRTIKKTRTREEIWKELRKYGMDYVTTTVDKANFRGFMGWAWIS